MQPHVPKGGEGRPVSLQPSFRTVASALFIVIWVLASCSGCQQTPATPDADARWPDAHSDAGPPTPDLAPPDRGPETAADLNPDGYPDLQCGGSRKLSPKPVTRGKGMACGKGCQQVTFGADTSLRYEVKGDLLVYSGGRAQLDPMLYLVNLKSDQEWLVQQRPKDRPGCFYVSTDGKRLAYSCLISAVPGDYTAPIQIFDPLTLVEQDLHCLKFSDKAGGSPPLHIQLGSTGIALETTLQQKPNQVQNVYLYRFSDNSFKNVSQKPTGAGLPHMSGHRIVWTENVNSKALQIILYDTITKTKKVLDPTGKNQYEPRIEGAKVVWMDNRNSPGDLMSPGNSDIYVHDLKTGKTTAVTTHPAEQDLPDVWGDWVVWLDWRRNPDPTPGMSSKAVESDIHARNMKTGKEIQLTSFKGMELRPRIDGKRVFFTRTIPKKYRAIFMIDLQKLGY